MNADSGPPQQLAAGRVPPPSIGEWCLYIVTVLAAICHTGQSIVFHNGIPGDLADARLGNCILEHFYQSLCGHAHFFSPSQFYPTKGTLLYSDNHFGTALLYSLFRVLGTSMERAFQGWILTVLAANTASLLYLLRRLGIRPVVACPFAFLGTASFALVYKSGHPQVLPFFPFILALVCLLDFLRFANSRSLACAALWAAYQNACYLYHGYFTVIIFAVMLALFFALGVDAAWWRTFISSCRQHARFLCGAGAVTILALVALYYPYARFSASSGTRPPEELAGLAPNLGAWFSASPFSYFYPHLSFYKPRAYVGENTLFAGWIILALNCLTLVMGLRSPRGSHLRLAAILTLACGVVVLALTTWPDGNIYLWVAEHVRSIRAFRSFARIAYLLIVVEAVAAAIFIDYLFNRSRSILGKSASVALSLFVAVESLAVGQIHYSKIAAQKRGAAVREMWQRAGARRVLAFAPGYSNQGYEAVNLDAWQAALLLHKHCLNGYSGNEPAGYAEFLHNPTTDHAKALFARLGVPESKVSLVTDWPAEFKAKSGIQTYHFEPTITPLSSTPDIHLRPLQEATLPVNLQSAEPEELDCDAVQVFASYRLFDAHDKNVVQPPSLRTAAHRVPAHGSVPIAVRVQAPARPGVYEIRLSMVQEGVAWWADLGSPGSVVKMVVE